MGCDNRNSAAEEVLKTITLVFPRLTDRFCSRQKSYSASMCLYRPSAEDDMSTMSFAYNKICTIRLAKGDPLPPKWSMKEVILLM